MIVVRRESLLRCASSRLVVARSCCRVSLSHLALFLKELGHLVSHLSHCQTISFIVTLPVLHVHPRQSKKKASPSSTIIIYLESHWFLILVLPLFKSLSESPYFDQGRHFWLLLSSKVAHKHSCKGACGMKEGRFEIAKGGAGGFIFPRSLVILLNLHHAQLLSSRLPRSSL